MQVRCNDSAGKEMAARESVALWRATHETAKQPRWRAVAEAKELVHALDIGCVPADA